MSALAVVFPGQGSQTVGMLSEFTDLYPIITETFTEASNVLDYSLMDLVQKGPAEKLNETIYTQVAMLVADVAMFRVIKQINSQKISFMAGHSLGEYAALVCSGVLGFTDAVRLVRERARLMQQHVAIGLGAMAAIVGLDNDVVTDLCIKACNERQKVMPANYNAIGQVVVAGHKEAVERLIIAAEAKEARLARLIPVSVPCHCDLLQGAAEEFGFFLKTINFNNPKCSVLSNIDAKTYMYGDEVRIKLQKQLYMPVQWVKIIQTMAQQGIKTIIECGPGQVLSGLIKRIDRTLTSYNINSQEALEKIKLLGE